VLDYPKYQEIDGLMLPKKLHATHRRFKIKMSLNRWSPHHCR